MLFGDIVESNYCFVYLVGIDDLVGRIFGCKVAVIGVLEYFLVDLVGFVFVEGF